VPEPQLWARGDAYEPYVGRWSRLVAARFLDWLQVPANRAWLDVGCGTGALSATIAERTSARRVLGVDPSDTFVSYARARVAPPVEFAVGEAERLPVADGSFEAVVSGLVLNFLSDPLRGLAEMARATAPGGIVAVYVWDYAGEMQLMRYFWDAAVDLDDAAAALDEGTRFPICKPYPLLSLARTAGLQDPQVCSLDVDTVFRDFDDYWSPFLGGQGPAPAYAMSLDEAARTRLRELIRSRLPTRDDGTIQLVARAWAVKGTVGSADARD
jgi:SAM-dependent methyltransferase